MQSEARRERIALGNEALRFLKRHESIDRWREVGTALSELQAAAMEAAQTNRPIGKRYNKAYAELAAHVPDLAQLETSIRTHAMWLANEWEAVQTWLGTLTHKERWNLNHPSAIRRRYDATHKPPEEKPAQEHVSYKQKVMELQAELDTLKAARGAAGSIFGNRGPEEIGQMIRSERNAASLRRIADVLLKMAESEERPPRKRKPKEIQIEVPGGERVYIEPVRTS